MLLLLLSRFSRVRLLVTPWTAAHQAPPSIGFSRQEYWSGVPLPSPKEAILIQLYFESSTGFEALSMVLPLSRQGRPAALHPLYR